MVHGVAPIKSSVISGSITTVKQPSDKVPEEGPAQAKDASPRERRDSHRIADNQGSGEGSLTALSRLKMIERKLAAWRAMRKDS
jgi:hypothetical protein